MYQCCYEDILVGPYVSLGDEETSENNTPFSKQICRGYNNVANTARISDARTVLQAQVKAHIRHQNRGPDKSTAEETMLKAKVSELLR